MSVARLTLTPVAAQCVHTGPVLADTLTSPPILVRGCCRQLLAPAYLHHLALVNLGEVPRDGVDYLAGPAPATELGVGRGGGRRTLLALPAPPGSHGAAADQPGLRLRHRGRAVVPAVLHEANLLPHVHTLLTVRGQHVVPGALTLVTTGRVDTSPGAAQRGVEGALVDILAHHALQCQGWVTPQRSP